MNKGVLKMWPSPIRLDFGAFSGIEIGRMAGLSQRYGSNEPTIDSIVQFVPITRARPFWVAR